MDSAKTTTVAILNLVSWVMTLEHFHEGLSLTLTGCSTVYVILQSLAKWKELRAKKDVQTK